MKFTLSWLRDHIDFIDCKDDIITISETLTSLGLEVEEIFDPSERLKGFKVGCIVEYFKHPNADKLSVCKVDIGNEIIEVICGANNLIKGMKVVFAPTGSIIPENNEKLKKTKIRGVISNGMLCSERELCISDEHDGIIELEKNSIIGSEASQFLKSMDPVFEIAITPNRQDCLGVRGIARDLSAKGLGSLKILNINKIDGEFESPIKVDINDEAKNECCVFFGRYIKGVVNRESPSWLKDRLISIGLKPISALVDITNYITFDLGRPLHVFDSSKIDGDLSIRMSLNGEKIIALNDKVYDLDDSTIIISDKKNVLSLAGIIGGKESGTNINTKDIFIESALFKPVSVAKSGRKYGIESDARYRFERGVDPNSAELGIELATKMVIDICGGNPSEIVKAGEVSNINKEILIFPEKINNYLGMEISSNLVQEILFKLGFNVKTHNSGFEVKVPSWRSDIQGEADLIEEISRVNGYDKIPIVNFRGKPELKKSKLNGTLNIRNKVRKVLVNRGFNECITWSFMRKKYSEYYTNNQIELLNPISKELDVMRPSIIPNLIEASKRNFVRGLNQISLFEIGPIFDKKFPLKQANILTLVRAGIKNHRSWEKDKSEYSVFDIKADIIALLKFFNFEIDKLPIDQQAIPWFHPGRSAIIKDFNNNKLVSFGEVHPKILEEMDIDFPLVAADIYLEYFPDFDNLSSRKPFTPSDFPSVSRDFSFIVDKSVSAQDLILPIKKSNIAAIKEILIFDVFKHESIDKNKKSIAITVILEPSDKTFTDSEIEKICKKIIKIANYSSGAELRN